MTAADQPNPQVNDFVAMMAAKDAHNKRSFDTALGALQRTDTAQVHSDTSAHHVDRMLLTVELEEVAARFGLALEHTGDGMDMAGTGKNPEEIPAPSIALRLQDEASLGDFLETAASTGIPPDRAFRFALSGLSPLIWERYMTVAHEIRISEPGRESGVEVEALSNLKRITQSALHLGVRQTGTHADIIELSNAADLGYAKQYLAARSLGLLSKPTAEGRLGTWIGHKHSPNSSFGDDWETVPRLIDECARIPGASNFVKHLTKQAAKYLVIAETAWRNNAQLEAIVDPESFIDEYGPVLDNVAQALEARLPGVLKSAAAEVQRDSGPQLDDR